VSSYRVAVVGGGLGGLCLAHGLLKALGGDADITVYERDASLAGRQQGYRLHLDARAGLALQQCLPPESLELFQASCAQPSRRMTVMTERLRVLRELAEVDLTFAVRIRTSPAVPAWPPNRSPCSATPSTR
jgi:cation diffusion facilitator CzcD-associated flavoprotein CzcO